MNDAFGERERERAMKKKKRNKTKNEEEGKAKREINGMRIKINKIKSEAGNERKEILIKKIRDTYTAIQNVKEGKKVQIKNPYTLGNERRMKERKIKRRIARNGV